LWNVGGMDLSASGDLILVAAFSQRVIFAMYPPVNSLVLMAGARGVTGSIEGTGSQARFMSPIDVKIHPSGAYALVADSGDSTVRRLFMNGTVTRFAGTSGVSGYLEGTGTNSRFLDPNSIAIAPSGTFALISEGAGHRIRRLDLTGPLPVSTFVAGSTTPTAAFAEGFGSSARFNYPNGIVISPDGTYALVSDLFNHGRIRRITLATQQVSTLVTMSGTISGRNLAWHPAMDSIFVTGSIDYLRRIRVPHGNETNFAGFTTRLGSTHRVVTTRCLITGY
jgi:DNA-binding beta-propeller fold protein YncE